MGSSDCDMRLTDPIWYILCFITPVHPSYRKAPLYMYMVPPTAISDKDPRPNSLYAMFYNSGAFILSQFIKDWVDITMESADCGLRWEVNGALNRRIL